MTNSVPPKVVLATRLMWSFWAAGAVYLVSRLYLAVQLALPGIAPLAIAYLVVLGLLALLIRAVARGRNWARITYSLLVALASLFIVVGVLFAPARPPVVRILLSGALVVGYAGIIWLLFQADSAPWFNKQRASGT
jgi:hypothetical protein